MAKADYTVRAVSGAEGLAGDVLVLGLFKGGELQDGAKLLGKTLRRRLDEALESGWISGKSGESLFLPLPGHPPRRLLLWGLGEPRKLTAEALRAAAAGVLHACRKSGAIHVSLMFPLQPLAGLKRREVFDAVAEGVLLGRYAFNEYKSDVDEESPRRPLERVDLLLRPKDDWGTRRLERHGEVVAGVFLARDLGNRPGNLVNPEYLAQTARDLSATYADLKVTVLDEKALAKLGMNGILAVGQGSVHPPRLITLEYRGGGAAQPLVVVGKGITFDTGGISLKPAAKMEEMKFDMNGAGAVLGLMRAVAGLKLPVNLVGIIPTAENMPSGHAQRPGDIIRTAKGVTVEVINTDAEGRLILADALYHAESFDPHAIIDLATLTGACVVALGAVAAGMMGNDRRLQEALQQSGDAAGERVWPLPLFDDYQEMIKSQVADIKNSAGREGGAITAACFLSRFVGEHRRWAHLDIAGAGEEEKGRPHMTPGARGFGVRLLVRFIEDHLL
ncbi:MAG: leucyl aminopeptidase [Magnetococcus sp. WYHC-3]